MASWLPKPKHVIKMSSIFSPIAEQYNLKLMIAKFAELILIYGIIGIHILLIIPTKQV
jgi:hypothetical protein